MVARFAPDDGSVAADREHPSIDYGVPPVR